MTGVAEKLFMCQMFMCLFRPLIMPLSTALSKAQICNIEIEGSRWSLSRDRQQDSRERERERESDRILKACKESSEKRGRFSSRGDTRRVCIWLGAPRQDESEQMVLASRSAGVVPSTTMCNEGEVFKNVISWFLRKCQPYWGYGPQTSDATSFLALVLSRFCLLSRRRHFGCGL